MRRHVVPRANFGQIKELAHSRAVNEECRNLASKIGLKKVFDMSLWESMVVLESATRKASSMGGLKLLY